MSKEEKKEKKEKKPALKRGTIERMKILQEPEYLEMKIHGAYSIETMEGAGSISRIVDIEKQEAIGFLIFDLDGNQTAIIKENAWK